jgi:hypothetical protein
MNAWQVIEAETAKSLLAQTTPSVTVPKFMVVKATFSADPHGTNAEVVVSNN